MKRKLIGTVALAASLIAGPMAGADDERSALAREAMTPDMVDTYNAVRTEADYIRREVMIPMRDGVKLYTVIVMRKGTKGGPILLSRTPYDAGGVTWRNASQKIEEILPVMDADFVNDGYIRVYQDVRGIHKSEGDYVMNRPLAGPLNDTGIDHSTDAYDTIDWLVKNVPESNGKVGIQGSSYLGFTALMALINPHPALKAAVPQSPMVDGWIGDDWFHNGAFRALYTYRYLSWQTIGKGARKDLPAGKRDHYELALASPSAGDLARRFGFDQFPVYKKMHDHAAYDAYWQHQAVDKLFVGRKLTVPTMLVVGQWDQEDSYGAPAVYKVLEDGDKRNDMVSLVIGPWRHSGVNYEARTLGALEFEGDTGWQFRHRYMKPFLDRYLKDGALKVKTPPVLTYATGADLWEVTDAWPAGKLVPIYLKAGGGLGFEKPVAGRDSYVSDPAHPVPFIPRPIDMADADQWRPWLIRDQRFVDGRPDVLTFVAEPLREDVHIAGAPLVDLFAATTGEDSDWVVKLIDVAPEEQTETGLGGYQWPIGIEIFRGRYVHGFSSPAPLAPGKVENYRFELPNVNHVFKKGHRIMVQVQSSLFPLYDRNPQTWVDNIFDARAEDYQPATQSVMTGGAAASAVWLPVKND